MEARLIGKAVDMFNKAETADRVVTRIMKELDFLYKHFSTASSLRIESLEKQLHTMGR